MIRPFPIHRRDFLATTAAILLTLLGLGSTAPKEHLRRFIVNGQRVVVVDGWVFTEAQFVESERTNR